MTTQCAPSEGNLRGVGLEGLENGLIAWMLITRGVEAVEAGAASARGCNSRG